MAGAANPVEPGENQLNLLRRTKPLCGRTGCSHLPDQRHGGQARLEVRRRRRGIIASRLQQAKCGVVFARRQQPSDVRPFGQRLVAQTGAIAPHHQRFGQHALARQLLSSTGMARRQAVKPLASALLLEQALVEFYRLTIAARFEKLAGACFRRHGCRGGSGMHPGSRCSVPGRHVRKAASPAKRKRDATRNPEWLPADKRTIDLSSARGHWPAGWRWPAARNGWRRPLRFVRTQGRHHRDCALLPCSRRQPGRAAAD